MQRAARSVLLWEQYLDEPFKAVAPRVTRASEGPPNQPIIRIGDLTIGEMTTRSSLRRAGADLYRRAVARHPHNEVAAACGYDAASHLQAMDIEGIDVAVLYGTRGRQVLMHDDLDPALAAALARAHNDWTHHYCATDPRRLRFAAQVAFHDPALAAAEARRAVGELGAVAVVGNPNPVGGRHIHDPVFEPLWTEIEELGVPIGFHPTGISSLRDDLARRYLDHPNARVRRTKPGGADDGVREPGGGWRAGAPSSAALRIPRRHMRVAAVVALAARRSVGEVRPRLGSPDRRAPERVLLPPVLRRDRRRREGLPQVTAAIGDDNIVVSTDYPHSDGLFPDAINEFLALEGIGEKTKAKILWDNCARLYPLAAT